jgi:hypothetical protein
VTERRHQQKCRIKETISGSLIHHSAFIIHHYSDVREPVTILAVFPFTRVSCKSEPLGKVNPRRPRS